MTPQEYQALKPEIAPFLAGGNLDGILTRRRSRV
jgi:hypothetical protein